MINTSEDFDTLKIDISSGNTHYLNTTNELDLIYRETYTQTQGEYFQHTQPIFSKMTAYLVTRNLKQFARFNIISVQKAFK